MIEDKTTAEKIAEQRMKEQLTTQKIQNQNRKPDRLGKALKFGFKGIKTGKRMLDKM